MGIIRRNILHINVKDYNYFFNTKIADQKEWDHTHFFLNFYGIIA